MATPHALLGTTCLAVVIGGCGPRTGDVAFREVCGEAGPVRILALDDDEAIASQLDATKFEDRWLYTIERFDRPVTNVNTASWAGADRSIPQVEARVESIDPCGEERRVVADGIDLVLPPKDEGGPWLGFRRDTWMLFVFDPEGAFDPVALARVHDNSRPNVFGNAVFVHREDERDIARFVIDGSQAEVTTLTAGVRVSSSLYGGENPPEEIFVLHDDGVLSALDLQTGGETVVEHGVRIFTHDFAGRWIAWAHGDPATPWAELPTEATLLDRATGERRALGSGGMPISVRILHGVIEVAAVEDGGSVRSTTFTALPDGASLTLDGRWDLFVAGDGGRFAALDAGAASAPSGYVFGLVDGELRELAGPMPLHSGSPQGLWYRDPTAYQDDPASTGPGLPYDLVHFSFADLTPRVEVPRIFSNVELPGDRWATVDRVDSEDFLGELVVIDGTDGTSEVIDRDVVPVLSFQPHDPEGLHPWATDGFVYQVRDPGSGRTGLWRVRFD